MPGKSFKGRIGGRTVDVRFALSGKVAYVSKFFGQTVKKWDNIASLDRKILQTELDRELADFEKVRADFEIFNQKNPDPQSAIDKYLKAEKQASLNASVKEVELAKMKLDQSDLTSPVTGVVLDDSGVVPGIFITPASASIKILDEDSIYFEIEIEQKEIDLFLKPQKCEIKIEGLSENFNGESTPLLSDGKKFLVRVKIEKPENIFLGMIGQMEIKKN